MRRKIKTTDSPRHTPPSTIESLLLLNPIEKQRAQIQLAAIFRLADVPPLVYLVVDERRHRALLERHPIRHQSHLASDHFYFPAF